MANSDIFEEVKSHSLVPVSVSCGTGEVGATGEASGNLFVPEEPKVASVTFANPVSGDSVDQEGSNQEDLEAVVDQCQFVKQMVRNLSHGLVGSDPQVREVISELQRDLFCFLKNDIPSAEAIKIPEEGK